MEVNVFFINIPFIYSYIGLSLQKKKSIIKSFYHVNLKAQVYFPSTLYVVSIVYDIVYDFNTSWHFSGFFLSLFGLLDIMDIFIEHTLNSVHT